MYFQLHKILYDNFNFFHLISILFNFISYLFSIKKKDVFPFIFCRFLQELIKSRDKNVLSEVRMTLGPVNCTFTKFESNKKANLS